MEFTKRRNVNRGYMKLDVWVQAQGLVKLMKEILDRSPGLGFKLRDQALDACCLCPANISEGYCRRSINVNIQFLTISL